MALKKFLDWSEFAPKNSAVDLFKESVRESLKFDFYGERDTFTALALTDSYPLTDVEAKGLGAAFLGANIGSANKYKFKARIIDENSPHMFLQDPCDPAIVGNKKAISSLIQWHTDILQVSKTTSLQPVSRGDIVEIQLHKNVFCYDMQMGIFNRILAKNDKNNNLMKSIGCEKLPGLYGEMEELSPKILTDTEIATESKGKWKKNPALNPQVLANQSKFMNRLVADLQSYLTDTNNAGSSLAILEVNSGFRTPSEQAASMLKNYNGAGGGSKGRALISQTYSWVPPRYMARILNFFAANESVGAGKVILDMQMAHIGWRGSHFVGEALDLKTGHLPDKDLTQLITIVNARLLGQTTKSGKAASWTLEPINTRAVAEQGEIPAVEEVTRWLHPGSIRQKRVVPDQAIPREHLHIELPAAYTSGLTAPSSAK